MRRALVLGGGGVVGVAWETGLLTGLLEKGIDLREIFGRWSSVDAVTPELCREIAVLALAARAAPEAAWIAAAGGSLGIPDRPETPLRVTAIDALTGVPGAAEKEAFGPDLTSPTAAEDAAAAGLVRGRALATDALAGWNAA